MTLLRRLFRNVVRPSSRRAGFIADERGTTAIEFAILGVPFFALVGAILETAYIFLASQILDTAVQDSARLVRTGQTQGNTYTPEDFRTSICASLYGLFDCSKLWIHVSTVGSFSAATITSPLPANCTPTSCAWTIPEDFKPGTGSSIVLVRVYYQWPTILNVGGFNLQNTGAGSRLLGAVRVFRNEPFNG